MGRLCQNLQWQKNTKDLWKVKFAYKNAYNFISLRTVSCFPLFVFWTTHFKEHLKSSVRWHNHEGEKLMTSDVKNGRVRHVWVALDHPGKIVTF